jgi:hypothetical protein
MSSKKRAAPDVMTQILGVLKRKMPFGVLVTDEDWNNAYDMVWATAAIETMEWKLDNISIKGEPKRNGTKYVWIK